MKTNFTKSIIIASLAIIGLSNSTNAQIITTIAGNGTQGYSGDGGLATSAELHYPEQICTASGNVYFTDLNNNVVRKISASGIITTIAGNGTLGYSGDGGLAINAQVNMPVSVAVDASGNVYFSDYNEVIRKVSASTGIITTIAGNGTTGYSGDGGLATSAELFNALGICLDSSGNIYIADEGNNRIRKITASTGIITTIVGTGVGGYSGDGGLAINAKVVGTSGLCVDASGNLYIADAWSTVRKINAATGIITTIAGTGTSGYSGDGGLATNAQLDTPGEIAVDASGNVYVADHQNHRIRRITASTGIISTIAGEGATGPYMGGYFGDGGLATSAELNGPDGVSVDASGNVYIADTHNNRIRKISSTTTGITEENNSLTHITVYPNPATTSISITHIPEKATLKLVDVLGNVVYENTTEKGLGSETSINTSELAQGIYTLVTESNQGRAVNKIVINK